jgi:hypothetical protein
MGNAVADDQWIYERSADGSARFVLGTVGVNPLVCFGINPSTAVPNAPDGTVARVSKFAVDSWTMLNVYPQIATDRRISIASITRISRLKMSDTSPGGSTAAR